MSSESNCDIGEIFGSEYKEKIAGFHKTFVRAKDAFDRSVALTTFAAVDGIGRCNMHAVGCTFLTGLTLSFDHATHISSRETVGVC